MIVNANVAKSYGEYMAYKQRLTDVEAAIQYYLASVNKFDDQTLRMVDQIKANGGAFDNSTF